MMAVELVDVAQLGNSETARYGRRYTEADKESAYALYASVAGRSTAKLARLTGIAERTLDNWRHDHGWVGRADQEAREAAQLWSGTLSLVIQAQALPSIMTAAQLRDDPETPPKVRLDASIWLAGLAGAAPIAKSATLTLQVPPPAPFITPSVPAAHGTDAMPSLPTTRQEAAALTPAQRQAYTAALLGDTDS